MLFFQDLAHKIVSFPRTFENQVHEALIKISEFSYLGPKLPYTIIINNVYKARQYLIGSTLKQRGTQSAEMGGKFGIKNALTTKNRRFHDVWLRDTKRLMDPANMDWNVFAAVSSQNFRDLMALQRCGDDTHLKSCVQILVFRACMQRFCPNIVSPDWIELRRIVSIINYHLVRPHAAPNQNSKFSISELNSRLREVFQLGRDWDPVENEEDRLQNPLSRLLPAYEMMESVVLRCVLELVFRPKRCLTFRAHSNVFGPFLRNPCLETFTNRPAPEEVSAQDVIKEALRLYPPYPMIKRTIGCETRAVDVQHLHREPEYFGANALLFDPTRWRRERNLNPKAFIPFGVGEYSCPAQKFDGLMMLAILVAVILPEIDRPYTLVGSEHDDVVEEADPLETDRAAYKSLFLKPEYDRRD